MNCKKFLMFVVCLAGFLFFAARANAQQVVVGVGTSAPWPTAAIAAVSLDHYTGVVSPCGLHIWTGKDGLAGAVVRGIDPRGGGPAVPGSIWVAWDNNLAPTVVCTYLAATSIDGLRLFYAQGAAGNGILNFATGAAPGNLIQGLIDTDPVVPAAVAALINGAHFNVAFTALRPEDAQFVYFRTALAPGAGGFNYNPGCAVNGTPILSSFSNTNNVSVSCFRISGTDPISTLAIPPSKAISIGAEPVILFYNTNGNLGAAGGPPLPTNILSKTATKFFSGEFGSSQSVFGPNVVNSGKYRYVGNPARAPFRSVQRI